MRLLKLSDMISKTGMCRQTINAHTASGVLPQPVRVSKYSYRRWIEEDVDAALKKLAGNGGNQ